MTTHDWEYEARRLKVQLDKANAEVAHLRAAIPATLTGLRSIPEFAPLIAAALANAILQLGPSGEGR